MTIFTNEYLYLQNTEAVTFFRKLADGSFDNGTPVANALRIEVDTEQNVGKTALAKAKLNWYLWAAQAGSTPAKTGDYILDATGTKWVVAQARTQAWGARYLLETAQER